MAGGFFSFFLLSLWFLRFSMDYVYIFLFISWKLRFCHTTFPILEITTTSKLSCLCPCYGNQLLQNCSTIEYQHLFKHKQDQICYRNSSIISVWDFAPFYKGTWNVNIFVWFFFFFSLKDFYVTCFRFICIFQINLYCLFLMFRIFHLIFF